MTSLFLFAEHFIQLGFYLHTVNKAYALLRDEGYVVMKGRKGAFVAQPAAAAGAATAKRRLSRDLFLKH